MTDAVADPMPAVPARLPEVFPGQRIQLASPGPPREDGAGKPDVAFQNPRKRSFFFRRGSAQGQGAGQVSRPIQVLRPRIDEQQAFRLDGERRVGVRTVMSHGRIGPVAADGAKTLTLEDTLLIA